MEKDFNLLVEMAEVYKALGDVNRLHIIGFLSMYKHHGNDTLCVCDIAEKLNITQSAVSQHLKVLKNIGIVESARKGFHKYYSINFAKLSKYMEKNKTLFQYAMTPCPELEKEDGCRDCVMKKDESQVSEAK